MCLHQNNRQLAIMLHKRYILQGKNCACARMYDKKVHLQRDFTSQETAWSEGIRIYTIEMIRAELDNT